jgi:predicted nucleotidyltransferase
MNKEIRKFNTELEKELITKLENVRDQFIDVIIESYDIDLTITNPKSKSDPQLYRDEFEERLREFEYFEREGNKLKFMLPTMDTFNFGGRLGIIRQILEGTVGIYVEVNAEDYEKMFGKRIYTRNPLDASVPKKELIYLMRYNSIVKNAERKIFERNNYLVRYPFSNTPPFPIFEEGAEFVENNMDILVGNTTKDTVKKYKKMA